jgi:uncharacterized protein YceH (UPF0502 family)
MKKTVTLGGRQVPIFVLIVIAVPLAIGLWWIERTIHWKIMYEGKVEAKVERLSQDVVDLTRRVERLEASRQTE